jgi:hypothetical protein
MTEAKGRIRVSLKAEPPAEPEPPREDIPRIVRLLALAHRWHRMIDERKVENQAEIARQTGLTAARISQIMSLVQLSPEAQRRLVLDAVMSDCRPLIGESVAMDYQAAARVPIWSQQVCGPYQLSDLTKPRELGSATESTRKTQSDAHEGI